MDKAVEWAVRGHEGTPRKSSSLPYVSHVFDVTKRLSRYGVTDPEWLAAAFLHDLVEDTDVKLKDIRTAFGNDVADIVDYVSWPAEKMTKQQKWHHMIKLAGEGRPETMKATVLKIADRVSNVEDYRSVSHSRKYAGKYALQGFPVFYTYIHQFYSDWESSTLRRDLVWVERLIQERFPDFVMDTTELTEAEAMLFGK